MSARAMGSLLVLCVVAAILVPGRTAEALIKDSHHDFGGASWSGGEICVPCHTPHGADTAVEEAPLWNHTVTSATYTLYDSETLDATASQPSGVSQLCLSCHDGTVAIDSFAGNSGSRFLTGQGLIGSVLSNHHPISIAYDTSLATADGELFDPSSTNSGLGGTIASDLLRDGRLECVSCHDVHIGRNTQGCSGCHSIHGSIYKESLSLWKSNAGSALCMTCHNK